MNAITRERFAQGMTYEEFKASMTRNRERFEENERAVELTADDLRVFRSISPRLNVLVLAEDWCGDVVANLPVLGRIARESGTLELRVFLRDQHPDLMDRYLNQGNFRSIPVFAFFDPDLREVGVFIERPATVTRLREERLRRIYAEHPDYGSADDPPDALPEDVRERLRADLTRMREELRPFAERQVIQELRALVEQVHA